MMIELSEERAKLVRQMVKNGHYGSEAEVVDEAIRLLQERDAVNRARLIEDLRQSIENMEAGLSMPADEVFDAIRREFHFSPDA